MIEVREYTSANIFLAENEESLLENESTNNLILGLANRMANSEQCEEKPLFLSILKDKGIVAQAIHTHQHKPIAITKMLPEEIDELIAYLKSKDLNLNGVVGEISSAQYFAKVWGPVNILGMHQGIYEIADVIIPKLDGEYLHQATEQDRGICQEFLEGFVSECFPEETDIKSRAKEILDRNLTVKKLFLLKNSKDEPVSMAANVRESRNAATISLVYTPKDLRAHGYGSKVTALISKYFIDNGKKKCNLFTDLSNPTSNSIYQKIGYKKIGESIHLVLKES